MYQIDFKDLKIARINKGTHAILLQPKIRAQFNVLSHCSESSRRELFLQFQLS